MNDARLSPDGHAVAFVSPVGGVAQVFLMLSSGGEPLQLTNDEGDKVVDTFSADGTEIYYERSIGREEVWAVPTLGGSPRRVVSGNSAVPSVDGEFIYYVKSDSFGLFRAGKTGLNEELVYNSEGTRLFFIPLLLFPGGNDLLAAGERRDSPNIRFSRINVTRHEAVDLGAVSGNRNLDDVVWSEAGNDPAIEPDGKWAHEHLEIQPAGPKSDADYFRSGTGLLAHARPGRKRDLRCEWQVLRLPYCLSCSFKGIDGHRVGRRNSTRHLAGWKARDVHHALPRQESELWVSNIDGSNKAKLATGENLGTGTWARTIFTCPFEVRSWRGSKPTLSGPMAAVFVSSHRR